MKYFIVSDVHGFYRILENALSKAGFDPTNPDHTFVSLGDLLDRGHQPIECLSFVLSLSPERRILIRGNHETLLQKALDRGFCHSYDYSNGTAGSVAEIMFSAQNQDLWNSYFLLTKPFAEVANNVFVHGWIPCGRDDDNKYHARDIHYTFDEAWKDGDWDVASWINGMDAWNQGIKLPDKTIFCGHWHTSWGHHFIDHSSQEWPNPRSTNPDHQKANFSPFIHPGIVALDACTALSHQINVYVLEVPNDNH